VSPYVWVVIGATALSGFFALTGFSLRAFRRVQLEEAFGHRRQRMELLERHLAALRLTTSFGRAAANVVLVLAMLEAFGAERDWRLVAPAVVTVLALIATFGVAIPHAWAQHGGEKVLAGTLPALMLFRWAMWPVIAFMHAFELPVRRLAGVRDADDEQSQEDAVKQEIIQAASEAQAGGAVEADEARMIASVMEFGDTEVGQVMTPRTALFALPVETSWAEACRAVFEAGHSRVPIYHNELDNIVGVLYAKDLLPYVNSAPPADLRSIMRKPFFVPETKRLDDLLREFKTRQLHVAVVLDEYGGTAGMVTIEDVLEEIVGEIADEYDRAEPKMMHRIDETTSEVDGRMPIAELNEAMALHVPEELDYTTAAGLVFHELGYIPTAGETLSAHGAEFTVLTADARKITRLRVRRLQPHAADEG
jgi:CBS domain containing-hemolysin-like protein